MFCDCTKLFEVYIFISSFSETTVSLSALSLRFLEDFSLAASEAENPAGGSEVFPSAVFSASVTLAKLVSLVRLAIHNKKSLNYVFSQ